MRKSRCRESSSRLGFTLIELLIVVAIIGILAAIAIPNFLEAQTRAKVARAESDERTLATAIEMYYVDNHDYMPYGMWGNHGNPRYLNALTTPVDYIVNADGVSDPFHDPEIDNTGSDRYGYYSAAKSGNSVNSTWIQIVTVLNFFKVPGAGNYRYAFTSAGPNWILECDDRKWNMYPLIYDPTNGTVSDGDILRFGP